MTRVSTAVAQIEWGTPPPPVSPNNYKGLTCREMVAIAESRPKVWASYDVRDTGRARVYASRLRDEGLEAVARRTVIYFRGGQR